MKIVAWNLAHQVKKRPIPDYLVDVIKDLHADTVLFNEYVDDESRLPFKEAMREAGFTHQAVSSTPARHNQIFAASRVEFVIGDLKPPQFDGSAVSNFLHLRFPGSSLEIVGLRAPAYTKAADKHAYWAELAGIMATAKERPILFAGDVNYDPFVKAKLPDREQVSFHLCEGYVIPNPGGEWSYLAHSGKGFKIDHVIHTPSVKVRNVEYVDWIRGRYLAGEKIKRPISDHAALRFEVLN
ncbi:MAG: endonuclease/exonuclease/phosphatase family protein [Verrucomicrobiae bacterium]|nr:endonuclease/exonuclease/phosphatase family protein [Verrucomicrobiae bacterium]